MLKIGDLSLIRLACVLFAAKIVLLTVLALNTRFVMDEFWQFGQAKYLWNGFYDTIWPVKSMGYALWYWPAHALGWDAASTLLIGRMVALVTVLATLGVIYGISLSLGFSRLAALMTLVLLLSVSTYMERSFRMRSETPAILFAALALWALVRPPGVPRSGAVIAAGFLSGLAFLATQKAVYFNLGLGLGLCGVVWMHVGLGAAIRAGFVLLMGWAAALLSYGVLMGGADAPAVLRQLFVGPADLAVNGGALYDGLEQFIGQTLMRNLGAYALFFAGLLLALASLRRAPAKVALAAIFTLVVTALVFLHNQPWPYVFAMALPFLALWAPVVWMRFVQDPGRRRAGLVVVAILVLASFGRNVAYLDHSNKTQLEVVAVAEGLLAGDGTYFDGIGMLPTHVESPRRWLDVPGLARIEAGRDDIMAALEAAPPDLIIETGRSDRLPPAFARWTAERYVALAPGFLVPGTRVMPGERATLIVMTPTVFDMAGRWEAPLLVDGQVVDTPVALEPGTYDVAVRGGDVAAFLVPEGTRIPSRQVPRTALFSAIYTR